MALARTGFTIQPQGQTLVVAAPTVGGFSLFPVGLVDAAPRMAGSVTGQSDLPGTVLAANVNNASSSSVIWGELVPA